MAYLTQTRYINYMKMDAMDEIDNITKNIVMEIISESKQNPKMRYLKTEEEFFIYFVHLLTLDPKWGISTDSHLNREKISRLVKFCIEQLEKENSPFVKTIMAQYLYMAQPRSREDIIWQHRNLINAKLEPLKEDILEYVINDDDPKQAANRLLNKIFIYIILVSGLGNPRQIEVMNQVAAAFSSVCNSKEIRRFSNLPEDDKAPELEYIVDLVTGIRIFNEKTGETYAGIFDFHYSLKNAVKQSQAEIQKSLVKITKRINTLSCIIEKCFELEMSESGHFILTRTELQLDENYISVLITFRQIELFMRNLLKQVEEIRRSTIILIDEKFADTIKLLVKTVKNRIALQAVEVYPLFCKLAQIQYQIQDAAILLSNSNKLFSGLVRLILETNYDSLHFKRLLKQYASSRTILTDSSIFIRSTRSELNVQDEERNILSADKINIKNIQLEYLGFCPWYLVETNGGLFPGIPDYGVLKHNGKFYIFASPVAAEVFSENPDKYILQIIDLVRIRTDLIHFLQVHRTLLEVKDVPILYNKPSKPEKISYDVEIQTELHPIESYIDRDYRWNVWDMYRDAIQLANITNCQTRSTQTNPTKSHFRSLARVQTVEYRSKLYQTKKDTCTNVPTLSHFIYGLRGQYYNKIPVHTVTLTRPVNE